jgi:predicted MPP superfamily phosphohydrolase
METSVMIIHKIERIISYTPALHRYWLHLNETNLVVKIQHGHKHHRKYYAMHISLIHSRRFMDRQLRNLSNAWKRDTLPSAQGYNNYLFSLIK